MRKSCPRAMLGCPIFSPTPLDGHPMATPWTLEEELCGLAGTASVAEALVGLGLVDEASHEPRLEEVHGWVRGGAETYIYRFRVVDDLASRDVMLKAVVAFSMVKSLTQLGGEWVERRRLLEQDGIRTPRLYFAGRALIVEEYIPERLSSFLEGKPAQAVQLADQVIHYAAALEKHAFRPVAPFHGLRTNGTDVFAVDFGQDLGPPGLAARRGRRLLREAIRWLNKAGRSPIDENRATAVFAFHAADAKSGGIT